MSDASNEAFLDLENAVADAGPQELFSICASFSKNVQSLDPIARKRILSQGEMAFASDDALL